MYKVRTRPTVGAPPGPDPTTTPTAFRASFIRRRHRSHRKVVRCHCGTEVASPPSSAASNRGTSPGTDREPRSGWWPRFGRLRGGDPLPSTPVEGRLNLPPPALLQLAVVSRRMRRVLNRIPTRVTAVTARKAVAGAEHPFFSFPNKKSPKNGRCAISNQQRNATKSESDTAHSLER